jgi:DNA (cytosine-5)-methyltransferase 1
MSGGSRPILLDLFCGAGGASEGYHRAGFDVYGVDHESQPRYPFHFVKADAVRYLQLLLAGDYEGTGGLFLDDIVAIHASPPCQAYSRMNRAVKSEQHKRLIPAVRKLLEQTGKPYVIENVEGAELQPPLVLLCGTMFGLKVRRHRLFEVRPAPVFNAGPRDCTCRNGVVEGRLIGHRVAGRKPPGRRLPPRHTETELREAMGCDWMTTKGNRQAIPPAYTAFIGKQLLRVIAQ